jgi:hypothetical protein
MAASLNYLASHSRNLESILQSYRQIDLTTQSVFLVLGSIILSRILETESLRVVIFLELLLIFLTVFSLLVMQRFQKVIIARGEDVTWWYKEMVKAELSLPADERAFTRFKIHQSRGYLREEQYAPFLKDGSEINSTTIEHLLDADLEHIRKVINTYIFRGIRIMWFFIALLSIAALSMKIYMSVYN